MPFVFTATLVMLFSQGREPESMMLPFSPLHTVGETMIRPV